MLYYEANKNVEITQDKWSYGEDVHKISGQNSFWQIIFGLEMYTGCVLHRAMIQFTPPDRYATIRKKGGACRMHCTAGQHIGKVGEGGSYGRPNRKE